MKLGSIIGDCSLINILIPWYEYFPSWLKNYTEKLYFGYMSINIDFFVKILLIKLKEREILYKMEPFALVLGSILIEMIVHLGNLKSPLNCRFIQIETING